MNSNIIEKSIETNVSGLAPIQVPMFGIATRETKALGYSLHKVKKVSTGLKSAGKSIAILRAGTTLLNVINETHRKGLDVDS